MAWTDGVYCTRRQRDGKERPVCRTARNAQNPTHCCPSAQSFSCRSFPQASLGYLSLAFWTEFRIGIRCRTPSSLAHALHPQHSPLGRGEVVVETVGIRGSMDHHDLKGLTAYRLLDGLQRNLFMYKLFKSRSCQSRRPLRTKYIYTAVANRGRRPAQKRDLAASR